MNPSPQPVGYLRVGGAALNQTPLDWRGNRERIVKAIRLAREAGVQVLCLPELAISGYGCEDAFHGESVAEQAAASLESIAPEAKGIAVAVGLPVLHGGALFNGVALLAAGAPHGIVAKRLLAGSGVYYEPRWFKAWPAGRAELCRVGPWEIPLGDLTFDLAKPGGNGISLGFEICEDAWGRSHAQGRADTLGGSSGAQHPNSRGVKGYGTTADEAETNREDKIAKGPIATGGHLGTDILLNPSASHFALDKYETLKGIVLEGSRQAHGVYLFSNLLGNEAGRLIYNGTILIASDGRLLAEGRCFSYQDVLLTTAITNLRANRLERRRLNYPIPQLRGRGHRVAVPFAPLASSLDSIRTERTGTDIRTVRPSSPGKATPSAEIDSPVQKVLSRYEEFARAVSLGLWDYLRKSGARGLVISLSGGIDSATVAVLGWLMVRLAVAELGAEEAARQIPNGTRSGNAAARDQEPEGLVSRLLTTVYQATENSSTVTRQAAKGLAQALDTRHLEWDVDALVKGYRDLVGTAWGADLSWTEHDAALQNIQARARSPGIWMLANLEGRLLVSTSNRSEIGVGYCTMDGDTSGGVAPIAGANKTFLRGWLSWMETQGLAPLGPLPALAAINAQAPTAELRPPSRQQSDEDDLMPYPLLDAIEQAAIRDRMAPLQVWRELLASPAARSVSGEPLDAVAAARLVTRFFRLWSQSQWKRERLAPSFHLDDENLDPKTWCRFPILSGGYEVELQVLAQAAGITEDPDAAPDRTVRPAPAP